VKDKKRGTARKEKKVPTSSERVLRWRGLRGRVDKKKHKGRVDKEGLARKKDMSSDRDSSSEAMESSEEAIAKDMMNLAIACFHAQQQSTTKAASASILFDFS